MFYIFISFFTLFSQLSLACAHHNDPQTLLAAVDNKKTDKPLAPVLKGLGDHHHPISTKNPETQKFFDQGLNLTFGFYDAQAIRAFQEAARLDPDCAMCWWGVAYALGPNINSPMNPQLIGPALDALSKAQALAPKATQEERDLIQALATRYSADPKVSRQQLDDAYAKAMGILWKKYPNNLDIGVLYAEAMMDTQSWDYWEQNRITPKGNGAKIISTLEEIIQRDPNHPQALHLYIHALEASDMPERAEDAADRLGKLMPGVGHIVHMPAHIYFRVGRYEDAVKANELANHVDAEYVATTKAQGFYSPAFYGHNTYFMWSALLMLGKEKASLEAARQVVDSVKEIHMDSPGPMEPMLLTPLATMIAFDMWKEILAEPIPPKSLEILYAFDLYARGVAHANLNDLDAAKKDQEALLLISQDTLTQYGGFAFVAKQLINLSLEMLEGEIARVSGKFTLAISHFEAAQKIEQGLPYMEPAIWLPPVAIKLGATLMQDGKPLKAEEVYVKSLQFYRLDGRALFGLYEALKAQGKNQDAEAVKLQYEKAWSLADNNLKNLI